MDSLEIKQKYDDPVKACFAEAEALHMPGMSTKEQRWASFRKLYKFYEREILAANPYEYVIDRYELGWDRFATPIEYSAWCDIAYSRIVLYPQYPIGRYFADFAHPKLKIALELDGAAWHNPEKDAKRDSELIAQGWTIYRVPGSECKRVIDLDQHYQRWHELEALEELRTWAYRTVSGVVEGIAQLHFPDLAGFAPTKSCYNDEDKYLDNKYAWAKESAIQHCVNFRPRSVQAAG